MPYCRNRKMILMTPITITAAHAVGLSPAVPESSRQRHFTALQNVSPIDRLRVLGNHRPLWFYRSMSESRATTGEATARLRVPGLRFRRLGDRVPCIACSLLPKNGHWFVELEKIIHGPYLTEEIAFGVAASEAKRLRG